jgi:hypothetical protein
MSIYSLHVSELVGFQTMHMFDLRIWMPLVWLLFCILPVQF